jgi:benzoylsuccinyl-CoA thiolase BbsA subunit
MLSAGTIILESKVNETINWAWPETVALGADGKPTLLGGCCRQCGHRMFPKPRVCPTCWSDEIDVVTLPSSGKLYSYAIVHNARKGWSAPYAIAYVDLPDGVRVCAPLDCDLQSPPPLDIEVELAVGRLRTGDAGNDVFSYRYSPKSGDC